MTRRFDITFPFAQTDKVIELGGGDNPRFRPNVDIRPGPTVDFVCDLNELPSESILAGSQYDGVYSQYALEHVSWRNVERFVQQTFLILKPGGHALFIIPNLIEQAKYVVAKERAGEFGDNEVCCIFGDQNYEGADWRANSHTAGFSPHTITQLFRKVGFESVIVMPHPETDTDMVVEARKPMRYPKKLEFDCENLGLPKTPGLFDFDSGYKQAVNAFEKLLEADEKRRGQQEFSKEEYDQLVKPNPKLDDVTWGKNSMDTTSGYIAPIINRTPVTANNAELGALDALKKSGMPDIKIQRMLNEGYKPSEILDSIKVNSAEDFTPDQRRDAYGHDYFNGGGKFGGYAHEGYWDYPVHRKTAQDLMNFKPESVLEIGPARGYVLKRLEDQGVRCKGLEASRHCFLTRVTDAVIEFDVTQTPWPFKDKEFDLAFSCSVMEHIPEKYLPAIVKELDRVTKRGFHAISFEDDDDGFDKTHTTLHDHAWWIARMPQSHAVLNKEVFERGPIPAELGDGKVKLNFGSYIQMSSHGWMNHDILFLESFARQHGFKFGQLSLNSLSGQKPIPYATDSVDLIFSSHMLEHLTVDDGVCFLKECHRIMKPGATMRLTVPDANKLTELFVSGDLFELDALLPPADAALMPSMKLFKFLADGHKTAYNWESLGPMLNVAGFKNVERKRFRIGNRQILTETHESLPELSLFVEAVK